MGFLWAEDGLCRGPSGLRGGSGRAAAGIAGAAAGSGLSVPDSSVWHRISKKKFRAKIIMVTCKGGGSAKTP